MAKKFAGFTPEQMKALLPKLGYTGSSMQTDEVNAFLASNPAAAAKLGKYTLAARRAIEGDQVKMQEGGLSANQEKLDTAQQSFSDAQDALSSAMSASQADPSDASLADEVGKAQAAVDAARANLDITQSSFAATDLPSGVEATATMVNDPKSMTTKADVAKFTDEQKAEGEITEGTGDAGTTTDVEVTKATAADDVTAPDTMEANKYTAETGETDVKAVMDALSAATGKPSDEALAEAATMEPDELAQLGLTAAQIEDAQKVEGAPTRTLEDGELIEGSTVDMDVVKQETNFEAATGSPSSDATVQGQLTGLMSDFEGASPPAWAAGAMRQAAATMAARGLSASSMAGQALVQAAMESALPIAQQDAQTVASFERQNLSNKQQAAMFAAEQRAKFLNLEFTQDFQARVANAAKISDIANMNFTAEQQVALENARMAQSVDLANLSAANAKVLADAAAMTQVDTQNLNNRQQANVESAKAFLQMDMQSLTNEQQTNVFKAQQNANAIMTDKAAENAAAQFNAASENQTDQFFANLSAQISQFNTEQKNNMERFNAGETNAVAQFNQAQKTAREQFNAENALIIAQANAQWAQATTTADNAAQNQANRDEAMTANGLTTSAYNAIIQRERDSISYAFRASENTAQRETNLLIASMQAELDSAQLQASIDTAKGAGIGEIVAAMAPTALGWLLKKF